MQDTDGAKGTFKWQSLLTKQVYATRLENRAVSLNLCYEQSQNYGVFMRPEPCKQQVKFQLWKLQFCDSGPKGESDWMAGSWGRVRVIAATGSVAWRGDWSGWVVRNPKLLTLRQEAGRCMEWTKTMTMKSVERSSILMQVLWWGFASGNLVSRVVSWESGEEKLRALAL